MIIVGGGVIGIEWASMLADFDVEVTIIGVCRYAIIPTEDKEISKEMQRLIKEKRDQDLYRCQGTARNIEKDKSVSISAEVKGEVKNVSC